MRLKKIQTMRPAETPAGLVVTQLPLVRRLKLWRVAPAGSASCFQPKHEKYAGSIFVPQGSFNKGDVWVHKCRHSCWRMHWQKHGAEVKEGCKGKQCTSSDVDDYGQKGYNKA